MNFRNYFPTFQYYPDRVYFNNDSITQILENVLNYINYYNIHYNNNLDHDLLNTMDSYLNQQKAKIFVNKLINNNYGKIYFGNSIVELFTSIFVNIKDINDSLVILSDHLSNDIIDCVASVTSLTKCWYSDDFTPDYNELFDMIDSNTKVVVLPHVSNINGIVFDIVHIIQNIRKINKNVIICVDGRDYVPRRKLDIDHLDVDIYSFSFNKFYCCDVSVSFVKNIELREMEYQKCNEANLYALLGFKEYMELISSFDNINNNHSDLINQFYNIIYTKDEELKRYFMNRIDEYKQLCNVIYDEKKDQVNIFALDFNYFDNSYVTFLLSECKIYCTNDRKRNDLILVDDNDDFIRISLSHYNTIQEIDYFMSILAELNKIYDSSSKTFFKSVVNYFDNWKYDFRTIIINIEFQHCFNSLVKDIYVSTNILNLYSLLYIRTRTMIGHNRKPMFKQCNKNNNKKHICTYYRPINIMNHTLLHDIIDMFYKIIHKNTLTIINYMEVEQVRIDICENDPSIKYTKDSSFISIICIRQQNIQNTKNITIFNKYHKIMYEYTVFVGHMLTLDTRQMHFSFNFKKHDIYKPSFIDLLILRTVF